MYRQSYRFFDVGFTLETDAAAFLACFEQIYGRFRAETDPTAPTYRLHLNGDPRFEAGGTIWRSRRAADLSLYAYNAILNAVATRIRSHFLFHAAALAAPDGAGIILAGPAGLGKTTLALALLARGYRLYSDDVAAVGCDDGLLYPFPRSVGVRPADGDPNNRLFLDMAALGRPDALASAPAAPRLLFLLADGTVADPAGPAGCILTLDRFTWPLMEALADLPDVRAAIILRDAPYPVVALDLATASAGQIEPAVQALCARYGVLLFDIAPGPAAAADFDRPPRLVPLSLDEATTGLLRHLKGGPSSALVTERFGGSAGRLYMALAARVGRMACYRLEVGRLEASVQLILDAQLRRSLRL